MISLCTCFVLSRLLCPVLFLASSLPASLLSLLSEDEALMRSKSAKIVRDKSTHERRDFVVNVCRTYFLLFPARRKGKEGP